MKTISTVSIVALSVLMVAPFVASSQTENSSRSTRTDVRRDSPAPVRTDRTSERSQPSAVRTEQPTTRTQASPERSMPSRRESSGSQSEYQRPNTSERTTTQTPVVRNQGQRDTRTETSRTAPTVGTSTGTQTTSPSRSDYRRPSGAVTTTTRTVETRSNDNSRNGSFERRTSTDRSGSSDRRYDNGRVTSTERSYDNTRRASSDRNYYRDRGERRDYHSRYDGRYEGRWDNRYTSSWKSYGYGKPRYVVYHQTRVYRAPYFSGIIRVRPPYYRNMPDIIYPEQRYDQPYSYYRPYWAVDYSFVRRWIFFPRLNMYWDNYSNVFVYMSHNNWRVSSRLPFAYFNIDLLSEPLFEVEEDYNSEDGYYNDGYFYSED